jgi:hypothetical protein
MHTPVQSQWRRKHAERQGCAAAGSEPYLVRKGQPFLVLDTIDLLLQLEQAEAEVRAATMSVAQTDADETSPRRD